MNQLLFLALQHPGYGDPGPFGDYLRDVFFLHLFLQHFPGTLEFFEPTVLPPQLLFQTDEDSVADLSHLFQVALPLGRLLLDVGLFNGFLDLANAIDGFLLILPVAPHLGSRLLPVRQLPFQLGEPFPGGSILLLGESLLLYFQLHDVPLDLIQLGRDTVYFYP